MKHVSKVLHSVHPTVTMSHKGMNAINDFLGDVFEHVADMATELMHKVGRQTLQARVVTGACALLLSGELKIFAMSHGLQALTLTADSYGLDTCGAAQHKFKCASKLVKI